ncbi:MAG TPA: glycerol-3-phosphate 1-O-acyltransferase PlsY [Gammaproteobacteria bacterium]|nr:glycerol-3-phosphate 1-O-acyltransferase PlsY [Gammaproteobacteria bacterium]
MIIEYAFIALAYLCGSLSSAVIVCRAMGFGDPRREGSKNPGATNVLRLYGKIPAALTLAGDVLKGFLPVFLASLFPVSAGVLALTSFAAFLGHLYPLYFGFRGGKGVATLIGILFGIYWLLGTAFVLTWFIVALLFRISSLAALTGAALVPVYTLYLVQSIHIVAATTLMAALLFWRHRQNIRNLIDGTEDKIGTDKH